MRRDAFASVALVCAMLLSAPATAQSGGTGAGGNGAGGLGGLLGGLSGGLPGVGSASVGNAAGLLSYCVKNRLLGGAAASSTLGALLGRRDVTSSAGFEAGRSGQLQTSEGQGLSLDTVKGKLKAKMCGMVLQHAGSFL